MYHTDISRRTGVNSDRVEASRYHRQEWEFAHRTGVNSCRVEDSTYIASQDRGELLQGGR